MPSKYCIPVIIGTSILYAQDWPQADLPDAVVHYKFVHNLSFASNLEAHKRFWYSPYGARRQWI